MERDNFMFDLNQVDLCQWTRNQYKEKLYGNMPHPCDKEKQGYYCPLPRHYLRLLVEGKLPSTLN